MTVFKRIAVLGDIHAEAERLEAALGYLRNKDVHDVFAVGDIVDGKGSLLRTCEFLKAAGVRSVAGNHERWLLTNQMRELPDAHQRDELDETTLSFLRALPPTLEIDTALGRALVCHGLGRNDMAAVRPDDSAYALLQNYDLQQLIGEGRYRFIINGHSHAAMVRDVEGLTIVNAGTLHREMNPGFLIVDFHANSVRHFHLDSIAAIREGRQYPLLPEQRACGSM